MEFIDESSSRKSLRAGFPPQINLLLTLMGVNVNGRLICGGKTGPSIPEGFD